MHGNCNSLPTENPAKLFPLSESCMVIIPHLFTAIDQQMNLITALVMFLKQPLIDSHSLQMMS